MAEIDIRDIVTRYLLVDIVKTDAITNQDNVIKQGRRFDYNGKKQQVLIDSLGKIDDGGLSPNIKFAIYPFRLKFLARVDDRKTGAKQRDLAEIFEESIEDRYHRKSAADHPKLFGTEPRVSLVFLTMEVEDLDDADLTLLTENSDEHIQTNIRLDFRIARTE